MNQNDAAAQAVKQGLSLLDRATEYRFCLLLVALILTTDIYLGWGTGTNLLTFDWTIIQAKIFGQLLLLLAGFFIYMALLCPVIQHILDQVLYGIYCSRAGLFLRSDTNSGRSHHSNMVSPHALLDRALRTNNAFEFQLYMNAVQAWERADEQSDQTARVSFACASLLLVDACTQKSIVRWLWQATPTTFHGVGTFIAPCAVALLFVYPWWARAWGERYPDRRIEYPPLAEELELKRRKRDPSYTGLF